jgi:hypothetical protein
MASLVAKLSSLVAKVKLSSPVACVVTFLSKRVEALVQEAVWAAMGGC